MNDAKAAAPEGRLDPLVGLVPAAIKAQQLMDKAAVISDLALDIASSGGDPRSANVFSLEAAKLRRDAEALLGAHLTPNTDFSRGAAATSAGSEG